MTGLAFAPFHQRTQSSRAEPLGAGQFAGAVRQKFILTTEPLVILTGVVGLVVGKAAIAFVLGRLNGQAASSAMRFALALHEGSELPSCCSERPRPWVRWTSPWPTGRP